MDRAISVSGVLVVAIDMTLAPEAPYPACVQDANWSALAEIESGRLERRTLEDRRVRQLERRPRRRAARHAPARCALQRDPAPVRAERCDGRVRGDALADQQHLRALPERRAEKARQHDKEQQDLLRTVGNHPRGEPAGNSRTPRASDDGDAPDNAGRSE